MSFFRSQSTIQAWVDEFIALRYPLAGTIRVLEQDGSGGNDTGLVVVELDDASTDVNVQPRDIGSPWWVVTLDSRETEIVLPPSEVMNLAAALTTVSALCAFLEAKSTAYTALDAA